MGDPNAHMNAGRDRLAEMIAEHDQKAFTFGEVEVHLASNFGALSLKEAAVMGFFLGQNAAGGVEREKYPKDGQVLFEALDAARAYDDLYPTLAALEE